MWGCGIHVSMSACVWEGASAHASRGRPPLRRDRPSKDLSSEKAVLEAPWEGPERSDPPPHPSSWSPQEVFDERTHATRSSCRFTTALHMVLNLLQAVTRESPRSRCIVLEQNGRVQSSYRPTEDPIAHFMLTTTRPPSWELPNPLLHMSPSRLHVCMLLVRCVSCPLTPFPRRVQS